MDKTSHARETPSARPGGVLGTYRSTRGIANLLFFHQAPGQNVEDHVVCPEDFAEQRRRMVMRIRMALSIEDPRILEAFQSTPRHLFVHPSQRAFAYEDRALPIEEGQTISQPSMIAIMLEKLHTKPHHFALEVGAGSGYAAALLSHLVSAVHAVEVRPHLAEIARENLRQAGIDNVTVHVADGRLGLPRYAPFDRILVSAAAVEVPEQLTEQLGAGGRIAIPVGGGAGQTLLIGERDSAGKTRWTEDVACLFVPLVSADDD